MSGINKELIFFPVFSFLLFFSLKGQDPKPPEIVDDQGVAAFAGSVAVNVLANDIAEDNHPLEIIYSGQSDYAMTWHEDSMIYFDPKNYYYPQVFPWTDTIEYRIKDLDNNLLSDYGYLIITVTEVNFDMERDTLSVNNFEVSFMAYGNYFSDFFGNNQSRCIIPKSSGKFTIADSYLALGGKQENGIHLSSYQNHMQYLSELCSDFMPGPISGIYSYSIDDDVYWNKVWKLSRKQIGEHIQHFNDPGYYPIDAILNWPGNGNPLKGQAMQLAPFVDMNQNGVYEPLSGDYPCIEGDEAIFAIYNDLRMKSVCSYTESLGVEVQQTSYAYACPGDSAFTNAFFINYLIINRSSEIYQDFYAGLITEFSIGASHDDYFGCDTNLHCYFAYNDEIDEPYYYTPVYGEHPPAQAVCFLNQRMNSFVRHDYLNYVNTYNTLQGLWPSGEPITVGGYGTMGTDTTTFLFPGDPSDPDQWSDIQSNPSGQGQKWGIGSVGPYNYSPGDTIKLDVAYVFARDYNGTNLTSADLLKQRVERIKWFYDNDSTPCGTPWSGVRHQEDQKIFFDISPNPAHNNIIVHSSENQPSAYLIHDISGYLIKKGICNSGSQTINVSDLQKGLYFLTLTSEKFSSTRKFIKQ